MVQGPGRVQLEHFHNLNVLDVSQEHGLKPLLHHLSPNVHHALLEHGRPLWEPLPLVSVWIAERVFGPLHLVLH